MGSPGVGETNNEESIMRRIVTLILCILAFLIAVVMLGKPPEQIKEPPISNFEECAKQGYPVMESYPRQCRTPSGKLFFEILNQ
jgi:hypothetical protein